jgi:hypothetical protein
MARKRREREPASAVSEVQARFAWSDATRVIEAAPAGEVLYEAPELRPVRAPRKAAARAQAKTLGLPFGVRDADGHHVCWSCGHEVDDEHVVRAGPGDARCPGCGAKLPFH